MRKAVNKYNNIVDYINQGIGWVLAIMLMSMTVLIFWQVFARFVMGSPLTFSEEYSRFIMIWLTLLGAAYAYRKGTLISIDIINEFAGKKVSRIFNSIVFFLSAIFAVVLVNYGMDMVIRVASQTAPSTGISMMWPNLAIPVGGLLIFLNSIALLIDEHFLREEGSEW
ncbi:TRAP transporter small permease [Salibacterium salarium]|uniref:TRAP transporter small permease n=1 Tax=Salibacterium salarium TaxID=284579 RepID=A0A3R9QLM5_9BACI|nr:TRAP transporter small permease [Salibacterium salarium]RSL33562.1 TRAP transporter small permease [Salibacterium salarium]